MANRIIKVLGNPARRQFSLPTSIAERLCKDKRRSRIGLESYNCYGTEPGAEVPIQEKIPVYKVPVPGLDEQGQPQWELLDNNSGQDIAMWHTQGPVTDRSLEKLGESDQGIIMYRGLLKDQMEKVRRGEDPMNVFRDPEKNVSIRFQAEENKAGRPVRRPRTGGTTKYSPILDELEKKGADVAKVLWGSSPWLAPSRNRASESIPQYQLNPVLISNTVLGHEHDHKHGG